LGTTQQQQKSTASIPQRHIAIIRDLRGLLEARGLRKPRILSFGCSKGYECIDIADEIPNADVYGCDIDQDALKEARKRCVNRATIFDSSHQEIARHSPFDAVIALNVLCRYPQTAGVDDISDIYPFADFKEGVRLLGNIVGPGGFLGIYNGAYFFEDAEIGDRYDPVQTNAWPRNGWIEKSLPCGRRATEVTFHYMNRDFKLQEWKKWMQNPDNLKKLQMAPSEYTYSKVWLDAESDSKMRDLAVTFWQRR